ncbi:MAG TPA: Ig-like domain-containing protein [Bryobacteraceae bacterium]|nr:Ig-like domain-containing protein [Bryobacteraceae bacterium]
MRDGAFRLHGWTGISQTPPAGWESVFHIYAGTSTTPMLGTYAVEGDTLVFHPSFPLDPNTGYRGTYPGGAFVLDAPIAPIAPPHVERMYPSADVLPANTLRLYVVFSAPMRTGEVLRQVRLLDDAGAPLPDAFLDQELWDPDHRRLTILFDPGRVKRGLAPAREAGSPLVEGRRYTLAIGRDFQKHFAAGPAIRSAADPAQWRVQAPAAGTMEPLVVRFPRPMDYALLQTTLSVPGIGGAISVNHSETEWRFTPDAPWKPGAFRLAIDRDLEDVCGNRPDRPFEVDLRSDPPDGAVVFTCRFETLPRNVNSASAAPRDSAPASRSSCAAIPVSGRARPAAPARTPAR